MVSLSVAPLWVSLRPAGEDPIISDTVFHTSEAKKDRQRASDHRSPHREWNPPMHYDEWPPTHLWPPVGWWALPAPLPFPFIIDGRGSCIGKVVKIAIQLQTASTYRLCLGFSSLTGRSRDRPEWHLRVLRICDLLDLATVHGSGFNWFGWRADRADVHCVWWLLLMRKLVIMILSCTINFFMNTNSSDIRITIFLSLKHSTIPFQIQLHHECCATYCLLQIYLWNVGLLS